MDNGPVQPLWSSDDVFRTLHPGVERFDPQRVADVVREVFLLEGSHPPRIEL